MKALLSCLLRYPFLRTHDLATLVWCPLFSSVSTGQFILHKFTQALHGWVKAEPLSLSLSPHAACALWSRARHARENLFLLGSNEFCRPGGNTCGLDILEAGKKEKRKDL